MKGNGRDRRMASALPLPLVCDLKRAARYTLGFKWPMSHITACIIVFMTSPSSAPLNP